MCSQKPILRVNDVWKRWRRGWVLKGVNLTIAEPKGVFIVGANGSGKTTLLRIICGLVKPTRGAVYVFGVPPTDYKARTLMGYVAHNVMLHPELTVRENLEYYAKLYGVQGYDAGSDPIVEELGLKRFLDVKVEELSFGWRKRADIARALVHRPKLLLIDEPLTGLDESGVRELTEVLSELVSSGVTVVATSPVIDQAKLFDLFELYMLSNGRLTLASA